jgi:DNA-binding beta-propeller fold protein YncE
MKTKILGTYAIVACVVFAIPCFTQSDAGAAPEVTPPLRLVQAIPLPNVAGRIDHFTVDPKRKWVIGSALGNNTVEIVDAFAGRVVKTVSGLDEPQGVLFVGDPINKLFVANAGDGKLRVYEGKTFNLVDTLDFGENTDNLRYVPAEKRVYVGYGEDEKSAIGVVDAVTNKRMDDAGKLDSHPESFQIELSGPRIFVNIASKQKIAVIDRQTHKVTDWQIGTLKANFPMALDEADHRLFIGTRKPSRLGVLDTGTGKLVATLPAAGDMDDLYYDDSRKRIYIPGGEGFLSVYEQRDPDHYEAIAKIPGAIGARTGVWYAKRDRLYIAVPGRANQGAEIWVYEAQD